MTAEPKKKRKRWLVYMVECANGALYTGVTNDLEKRVRAHNSGRGAMYTKFFGPVRLVFREPKRDHSSALKREYAIKQLTRARKIDLITIKNSEGLKRRAS